MKSRPAKPQNRARPDLELAFRRGLRLLPPDVHPGLRLWLRRLRRRGGRDFWKVDASGEWHEL